ncbi:hypothetical protein B0T18DRAFT_448937 [Schizothecium vesticola]|uniref:Uncharacterized protein n=1 Tax=Schizothecium vesticola TaxID=314040 RepID=A0AA40EJ41_9PEZI|nr:hypothetical protein B0T18DRAFT_448937 [Schizothecium vesticola]
MRPTTLLSALLAGGHAAAAAAAAASSLTIPPHPPSPSSSAEDPDDATTQVTSYSPPDLPSTARLVRIGAYDSKAGRWTSSVTVASAENFGKGYSPHFVVNLDEGEEVVSVVCRGVRIDAGHTRDFGPQVEVVTAGRGEQVKVNQPVVLVEGRKVVVEEKSMIQKYWWVLAIGAFIILSGGGDGK